MPFVVFFYHHTKGNCFLTDVSCLFALGTFQNVSVQAVALKSVLTIFTIFSH